MNPSLTIPHTLLDEVIAQARAEAPNECCGFLAGRVGAITHRLPLVNVAESPTTRFLSSPESTFAAMKQMRALGLDVLAVYHSHPTSPPTPSKTDLQWNYSEEVVNIIVSLAGAEPHIAAWSLAEGQFRESTLTIN